MTDATDFHLLSFSPQDMSNRYKSDANPSNGAIRRSKQIHVLPEELPLSTLSINVPPKEVTVATYSELRVFVSSSYRCGKSYTSKDFERFQIEAFRDARRIFDLVTRFPIPTGTAVQSVIGLGLLHQEELVGIEHLITPRLTIAHLKGRKTHTQIVLDAQRTLEESNVSDEVAFLKLAKVAAASSSKHVEEAKIRAQMSLQADQMYPICNVRSRKTRCRTESSSVSFDSKVSVSSKDEDTMTEHAYGRKVTRAKDDDTSSATSSRTSLSYKPNASKLASFAVLRSMNAPTKAKRTIKRTAAHAA